MAHTHNGWLDYRQQLRGHEHKWSTLHDPYHRIGGSLYILALEQYYWYYIVIQFEYLSIGMSISGPDCTTPIIALVHCTVSISIIIHLLVFVYTYPHTVLTKGMTDEHLRGLDCKTPISLQPVRSTHC